VLNLTLKAFLSILNLFKFLYVSVYGNKQDNNKKYQFDLQANTLKKNLQNSNVRRKDKKLSQHSTASVSRTQLTFSLRRKEQISFKVKPRVLKISISYLCRCFVFVALIKIYAQIYLRSITSSMIIPSADLFKVKIQNI